MMGSHSKIQIIPLQNQKDRCRFPYCLPQQKEVLPQRDHPRKFTVTQTDTWIPAQTQTYSGDKGPGKPQPSMMPRQGNDQTPTHKIVTPHSHNSCQNTLAGRRDYSNHLLYFPRFMCIMIMCVYYGLFMNVAIVCQVHSQAAETFQSSSFLQFQICIYIYILWTVYRLFMNTATEFAKCTRKLQRLLIIFSFP